LSGLPLPEKPPLAQRIDTAVAQIEHAAALRGERPACLEARRHLCWYLRGVPYAGAYKAELVRVETLEDVRRAAARIKRDLR
ncbi:MAG: tRNA dihydrouridine synthase DusB, partial [Oscillospiraceae bacterium]|nr:tRNA dihydrouridine synthase DusB [Oscillospiraceae bacterium]